MPPGPHPYPLDGRPRLQPPEQPGDLGRLDRYRVVDQLGEGGMGVIYLGIDSRLRRRVALKVIRPQFAASRAARSRFLKESRALAAVRHDNVVTLYDVGEADGTPFLAMEYLRGVSLHSYLRRVPIPTLAQALRIAREVASGLSAAHALGVVHRDVKPENIWLEAPHGRVKLIDFGLARPPAEDGEGADLSKPGAVIGTPAYMPPEQARGLVVDHRADLYSVGVLLYEMSTGRLPYTGENPVAVMIALATTPPPPPRAFNPAIPAGLESLILRLLAKDPAGRPTSARDVVAELARLEANPEDITVPDAEPADDPIPTADPARHVGPLPVGAIPVLAPPESAAAESAFSTLADAAFTPLPSRPRAASRGYTEWAVAGSAVLLAVVAAVVGFAVLKGGKPAATDPVAQRSVEPANGKPAAGRPPEPRPPTPFLLWKLKKPPAMIVTVPGSEILALADESFEVRSYNSDAGPHHRWMTFAWPDGANSRGGWVGAAVGKIV
ncbi:MAG: protein kinase domain-containing protein, partial [Fimbriiglobus sp.]